MEIAFPIYIDREGILARTSHDLHIRQMIQLVLFTGPGERVNRPDFCCGLDRLVFDAAGNELITTTQSQVQSQLQRWLGELIQVETVDVEVQEAILTVTVRYRLILNGETREDRFQW